MTRDDIANALAERGLTKADAKHAVDGIVDIITDALQRGEKIYMRGFGTFSTLTKKPRTARDVYNAKQIMLPERRVAKYKPSKALNASLNNVR